MSKPFFSIIIPALNEAKYLPKLLKDLSLQSYHDFEVIIVDGQSEDQTVSKARLFMAKLPNLNIFTSTKRHVCTQRNLGAKHAKADWLIFMDADNRLPTYFLQGIKYRLESQICDIANTWILPEKNQPQYKVISSAINLYYETEMNFSNAPSGLESMIIVKKNIFMQIGGFDPNINLAEGRYLVQSIIKSGGVSVIFKDPQYTYSLRRLKRFGTLRTISAVAQSEILALLNLSLPQKGLTQKLYPMLGGKVYDQKYQINKKRIPKFIHNIQKQLLKEL
jgi:glycosyltransferase involved in cell wall biosynthesis